MWRQTELPGRTAPQERIFAGIRAVWSDVVRHAGTAPRFTLVQFHRFNSIAIAIGCDLLNLQVPGKKICKTGDSFFVRQHLI